MNFESLCQMFKRIRGYSSFLYLQSKLIRLQTSKNKNYLFKQTGKFEKFNQNQVSQKNLEQPMVMVKQCLKQNNQGNSVKSVASRGSVTSHKERGRIKKLQRSSSKKSIDSRMSHKKIGHEAYQQINSFKSNYRMQKIATKQRILKDNSIMIKDYAQSSNRNQNSIGQSRYNLESDKQTLQIRKQQKKITKIKFNESRLQRYRQKFFDIPISNDEKLTTSSLQYYHQELFIQRPNV